VQSHVPRKIRKLRVADRGPGRLTRGIRNRCPRQVADRFNVLWCVSFSCAWEISVRYARTTTAGLGFRALLSDVEVEMKVFRI
jgi:hypothetical protein